MITKYTFQVEFFKMFVDNLDKTTVKYTSTQWLETKTENNQNTVNTFVQLDVTILKMLYLNFYKKGLDCKL